MDLARKQFSDLGKSVLLIGLFEGHLAFWIRVVAKKMGELLQDQNDPDGAEQTLNHTCGERSRKGTGAQ